MLHELLKSDFMFGVRGVLPANVRKHIMQARFDALVERHFNLVPSWLPGVLRQMIDDHRVELESEENRQNIYRFEFILEAHNCWSRDEGSWLSLADRVPRMVISPAVVKKLQRLVYLLAIHRLYYFGVHEMKNLIEHGFTDGEIDFDNIIDFDVTEPVAAYVAEIKGMPEAFVADILVSQATAIMHRYKEAKAGLTLKRCGCCYLAPEFYYMLAGDGSMAKAINKHDPEIWNRVIDIARSHGLTGLADDISLKRRRGITAGEHYLRVV